MEPMKRTIFENIKIEIITLLKETKNEVKAMIAWLTDDDISKILINLANNGIEISIILSNSEWNLINKNNFETLLRKENVEIRSFGSISPICGNFMHRKLCIIDKIIVVNGSYNWTKNATKNQEDLCINYNEQDAEICLNEFVRLWEQSKLVNFENIQENATRSIKELIEFEEKGITPEQYHNEIIAENDVFDNKKEESIVHDPKFINQELAVIPYRNNNFTFELLLSERVDEPDQLYVYSERLLIWGIESMNYWLKLKFEYNNDIFDIYVSTNSFKEVLNTNKMLFQIYLKFEKQFPLALFNCNAPFIGLEAPITFKTLTSSERNKFKRCKLKLITQKDGLICQKIFHHEDLDHVLEHLNDSMGLF
jgi:hypothetical protein